jgi:hypothetical protein
MKHDTSSKTRLSLPNELAQEYKSMWVDCNALITNTNSLLSILYLQPKI